MVSLPELTLLFIIGLLVLGPERLPRVASQIGRWVGKARRTANQLRYQLEREIALADLEKAATAKAKDDRSKANEDPTAEPPQDGEPVDIAEAAEKTENIDNTDNKNSS